MPERQLPPNFYIKETPLELRAVISKYRLGEREIERATELFLSARPSGEVREGLLSQFSNILGLNQKQAKEVFEAMKSVWEKEEPAIEGPPEKLFSPENILKACHNLDKKGGAVVFYFDPQSGRISLDRNLGEGSQFVSVLVDEAGKIISKAEQGIIEANGAREIGLVDGVFLARLNFGIQHYNQKNVEGIKRNEAFRAIAEKYPKYYNHLILKKIEGQSVFDKIIETPISQNEELIAKIQSVLKIDKTTAEDIIKIIAETGLRS